jgi:hypothetical protein
LIRICVIGDSQAGAIKVGWDRVRPEFQTLELTFFAHPGRFMSEWDIDRDSIVLRPAARAMLKNEPSAGCTIGSGFDYYLLCGLDFGASPCLQLFRSFRLPPMGKDARVPISLECAQLAIRSALLESLAAQWAAKLDCITEAPKGLIPVPMTGESRRRRRLMVVEEGDAEKRVRGIYDRAAADVAGQLSIELFAQPVETLASPLRTRSRYERDDDNSHMNWDFGELVVRRVLSSILARFVPADHTIPALRAEDATLGAGS